MATIRYFKGDVFHTPTDGKLEYIEEALIQVDDAGIITKVTAKTDQGYEVELAKESSGFIRRPVLFTRICRSACPRTTMAASRDRVR